MGAEYKTPLDLRSYVLGVTVGIMAYHAIRDAADSGRRGVGSNRLFKAKEVRALAAGPAKASLIDSLLEDEGEQVNCLLNLEDTLGPVSLGTGMGGTGQRAGDKLTLELEAFKVLKPSLLSRYLGRFVAVHQGRIIDSDENEFRLGARTELRAQAEGPIPICKVDDDSGEPAQEEYPFIMFDSPAMEV